MGDRNNPIKFGPEWLRNLARERSTGRSGVNNTTSSGPSGASGAAAGATGGQPNSSSARLSNQAASNIAAKVQLAKLRYGREEMLALYESTADAPPELQNIDILYQARPKPPLALNNSFEDEMRDVRNIAPTGSMSSNDRFTSSRGTHRVHTHMDGRGKSRGSYVRQLSTGRGTTGGGGWNAINCRMPTFALGPDEETNLTRNWNNSTLHATPNRNNNEQPDWTNNKVFRSKRPGNHTNWRQQHSREEGEEWRAEPGRSRPQPDKWERDWGDRSNQGERQPWTSNRRSWVSGDPHNNDDLPEWAVENAEACGGTFDSSGAFHGYSNDDSNLPKNQEVYPLTRSHTHGSFARQKTAEDLTDDWWSSDKAKKLSPKRFDASDIKFKKPSTGTTEKVGPSSSKAAAATRDEPLQEIPEKLQPEKPAATPEPPEGNNSTHDTDKFNKNNTFKQQFSESKTFDALMRSDINMEEASDERGNFQSVMIAPNNSLRQKHQNMVPAAGDGPKMLSRHDILQIMQANSVHQHNMDIENMIQSPQKSAEESILDELMEMKLDDKEMIPKMSMVGNTQMMSNSSQSGAGMPSGMATAGNNMTQNMQSPPMQQMRLPSPGLPSNQGMVMNSHPNMNMAPGMQGMGMQSIGITNSALNASLGLSIGPNMGMPLQGVPPPAMPGQGMPNNMNQAGMQPGMHQGARGRMPGFPSGVGMPGMPGMPAANMDNRSLFLRQNPANNIQLPSDIPMPNHRAQSNMFPNHGLQQGNSTQMFGNSMYGNMMHQPSNTVSTGPQNMAEQWYYEDPKKTIQGPFSSKEMYNWYRAGFFSPTLMVRRACEVGMRPLGSYGPIVPFAQMDMLPPFPMSGGFEPRPQQHENMLPSQQGLGGMDVMNIGNMNMSDNSGMDSIQFGSVGVMRNPPFPQPPPMMDSLWGQPSTPTELLWMQQAMQNSRTDARVNNLAMFLWDQQPNTNSNSMIPEDIVKEMKTEDQILAQLRAQSIGSPQNIEPPRNMTSPPNLSFIADPPIAPAASQLPKPDDSYLTNLSVTPNLEELEKLLQKQSLATTPAPEVAEPIIIPGPQPKPEKPIKTEQPVPEPAPAKPQNVQNKVTTESKAKVKADVEKTTKNKENSGVKTKTKKAKEEKKEEVAEVKPKEDEVAKVEKKAEEEEKRASSKSKKEEKANAKKDMDKEKKEWIKDGFTIVKGAEKSTNKESKKKADEAKAAEAAEAERKRKEEEKLAVEEDKKKKQAEAVKKQQEQQQRQISESVMKKAPWSAVTTQAMQTAVKEPTLAEIQRLEREKKLEQMKEQQQMMQIIAQQQAAALAREQEMQAGLGWAKKMANNVLSPSQSLAEIQAEARKQSAAAAVAAAAAQAQEEAELPPPPPVNNVPWATTLNGGNGGGFWDTQPNQPSKPEKAPEPPKVVEPVKSKKKLVPIIVTKKEVSPAAEFETWCTTVLASYSAKIDVPTFIGFLKDIESPYDVKDYVKCYLGDTKDSNDFARQFLERRSKMIRVGMITPSDDLCSPAIAVNPRTVSGSDYQEVKGKGKKTKKNKMMKIDARILGFSVTASEDRINVGDIDSV